MAMVIDDDDEFHRPGRLASDGDEERTLRRLFGHGSRANWRGVTRRRAGVALGGPRSAPAKSVVVKAISSLRGRADVVRLINYIGRLDGQGEGRSDRAPVLRDGEGARLDGRSVVSQVLSDWGIDDVENLTQAGRVVDALETGGRLVTIANPVGGKRGQPGVGGAGKTIRLMEPGEENGRRIDPRVVEGLERSGVIAPVVPAGSGTEWRQVETLPDKERFRRVPSRRLR